MMQLHNLLTSKEKQQPQKAGIVKSLSSGETAGPRRMVKKTKSATIGKSGPDNLVKEI